MIRKVFLIVATVFTMALACCFTAFGAEQLVMKPGQSWLPEGMDKSPVGLPKPKNYTEVNIDGGCHAYFGSYGPQNMDGTPTITVDEQQKQTLDAILAFIKEQGD